MTISTSAAQVLGGDPMRIAAQIITGIGFLGAGAVLHSHGYVMGLTTAATIWVVAGVGMALGAGMYLVAVFATVMSLVTLYFLGFIEKKIQSRKIYSYDLEVSDLDRALSAINTVLHQNSIPPASLNFRRKADHYRVWFNLLTTHDISLQITRRLSEIPEITQLEIGGNDSIR
jgi:putative Mg2+ transporter-C (MgtC) family protein